MFSIEFKQGPESKRARNFPLKYALAESHVFLHVFFTFSYKYLLIVIIFSRLIMMCLVWNSLSLSCLGFTEFLESVSLCLLSNLENFQSLLLQIFL